MKDKRLLKSSSNRMISGVSGGIGEFFGIDPTVIRLIWAILTFCGLGGGILIYIIAAVVIPEY